MIQLEKEFSKHTRWHQQVERAAVEEEHDEQKRKKARYDFGKATAKVELASVDPRTVKEEKRNYEGQMNSAFVDLTQNER